MTIERLYDIARMLRDRAWTVSQRRFGEWEPEDVPDTGLGRAINDRLKRAAQPPQSDLPRNS